MQSTSSSPSILGAYLIYLEVAAGFYIFFQILILLTRFMELPEGCFNVTDYVLIFFTFIHYLFW